MNINRDRRRGVRHGPRPHLCRGGDGGFVEIPPSSYEWEQWARNLELQIERDDYLAKPELRESFHERYRREYERTHAVDKLNAEPFDREGKTLPRPRDAAKLETPPRIRLRSRSQLSSESLDGLRNNAKIRAPKHGPSAAIVAAGSPSGEILSSPVYSLPQREPSDRPTFPPTRELRLAATTRFSRRSRRLEE
jgi:hypothetical protein